jgi:proteasome lid subunit RPN8/RPN11
VGAARPPIVAAVLRLTDRTYLEIVGHVLDGLPDEACGLLAAAPRTDKAIVFYPCRNAAASAKVYTVDPRDHLRADRDAESRGLEIAGVVHSHTHTTAYPSPTDVAQAPDPAWHYVIVSLRDPEPVIRSYRIVDGKIDEEPVVVERR